MSTRTFSEAEIDYLMIYENHGSLGRKRRTVVSNLDFPPPTKFRVVDKVRAWERRESKSTVKSRVGVKIPSVAQADLKKFNINFNPDDDSASLRRLRKFKDVTKKYLKN